MVQINNHICMFLKDLDIGNQFYVADDSACYYTKVFNDEQNAECICVRVTKNDVRIIKFSKFRVVRRVYINPFKLDANLNIVDADNQ